MLFILTDSGVKILSRFKIELITVKCRTFYLPHELMAIYITGIYLPPSANMEEGALQ